MGSPQFGTAYPAEDSVVWMFHCIPSLGLLFDALLFPGGRYYLTRQNNHDMQIGTVNGGATSNCNGNQSLPDSCYMQNASGHFINPAGQQVNCTNSREE